MYEFLSKLHLRGAIYYIGTIETRSKFKLLRALIIEGH